MKRRNDSKQTTPLQSQRRRDLLAAGATFAATISMPGQVLSATNTTKKTIYPQSIPEAARRLRNGSLTSVALTTAYYKGIDRLENKLAAFITQTREKALETAAQRDKELKQGRDRGLLHGIPIVHKDLFDTAGIPTTGGSEFFRNRVPTVDATVVRKLDAAGVVVLGKTNMNELAAGIASTNKAFGDTPNPWDLTKSSGGSSQGTGAAIAAGYCLAGTGGDTGGSIRVPASWGGFVGIRPTYGLVSLAGVMGRAHSLDTAGPMGRTVADVAIMLDAMAGYDSQYKYSVRSKKEDYFAGLTKGVKGVRIGIIDNYSYRDVDSEVAGAVQKGVETLSRLGADVKTVKIPLLGGPFNYSFLFDMVLYEVNQVLGDQFRSVKNNKEVFGPVVQANIAKGETISRETYEAARTERPRQIAEVRRIFEEVDVLITPTMPMTAMPLYAEGAAYDRGRQFSLPISFLGFPSVSVPCGFSPTGLPIGMLVIGNNLQEAMLLRVAAAYEAVTRFYERRPALSCEETA